MKKLFSMILLFFAGSAFAQSDQKDIVEQVWKPFILTTNEMNTTGFMALHSKDVVRASSDNGSVMGYAEYEAILASGNQNFKLNKFQRKFELRFSERWVNQNLAYETGIYKSQTIRSSGITSTHFGRFHVVLRKEAGVWKILMDADSSEGGALTEKEFLSAKPME
jgi:ketosteroid isomerase-like protein